MALIFREAVRFELISESSDIRLTRSCRVSRAVVSCTSSSSSLDCASSLSTELANTLQFRSSSSFTGDSRLSYETVSLRNPLTYLNESRVLSSVKVLNFSKRICSAVDKSFWWYVPVLFQWRSAYNAFGRSRTSGACYIYVILSLGSFYLFRVEYCLAKTDSPKYIAWSSNCSTLLSFFILTWWFREDLTSLLILPSSGSTSTSADSSFSSLMNSLDLMLSVSSSWHCTSGNCVCSKLKSVRACRLLLVKTNRYGLVTLFSSSALSSPSLPKY